MEFAPGAWGGSFLNDGVLVKASGVSVARGGNQILRDIDIEVREGDFLSVVGPNGAGKTTLVKVLSGIVLPDSGLCERKSGLSIGYMPQSMESVRYMPVSVRRFIRLRHETKSATFEKVCREAGVESILTRKISDLSGGEFQHVLLARALMKNPDLLVLDEPAQNLDISGQLGFYKLLEKIHLERGTAILMVSHDLHMVMSSTKKVVCMYGHICCAGEPLTVAKDPEFISMFGVDMARLISFYSHTHEHTHGHFQPRTGGGEE